MNGTEFAVKARSQSGYTFYYSARWDLISQNAAGNYSTIRLYSYIVCPVVVNWSSGSGYLHTATFGLAKSYPKGNHLVQVVDINVQHDANGNGSVYIGAGITTTYVFTGSNDIGGTIYLPKIDRNPPIVTASVTGYTDSTASFNSSANVGIDHIQYSFNGGVWTDSQASVIRTGLNANTNYTMQYRMKRTSNQVWGYSNVVNVKTQSIPIVSLALDFFTENIAQFSWSANTTIDNIQQSINGGTWTSITNKNPINVIDLKEETNYTYQIRVKKASNTYYGLSNIVNFKTLAGTFCTVSINGGIPVDAEMYIVTDTGIVNKVTKDDYSLIN